MSAHIKKIKALEQCFDIIKDLMQASESEPLYNFSQLNKLYGMNRAKLSKAKKEGRLQTYDGKARYSDALTALKDQPVSPAVRRTGERVYPPAWKAAVPQKLRAIL